MKLIQMNKLKSKFMEEDKIEDRVETLTDVEKQRIAKVLGQNEYQNIKNRRRKIKVRNQK